MGVQTFLKQTIASMPTIAAGKAGITVDSATKQLVLKNEDGTTVLIPGVPGQLPLGALIAMATPLTVSAAAEAQVLGFSIPANSLVAGTTFRITATGTFTWATAGTTTIRIRIGTTTLTGNIVLASAAITGAAGTSIPFDLDFLVTVRTNGAGGTIIGGGTITNNGATGLSNSANPIVIQATATVVVDTTAVKILELTHAPSTTTATPTYQTAMIEVVKS
jgi:hypothetical protein